MRQTSTLVALAATVSTALGAFQGFNYGSTFTTGAPKQQSDFEAEFKTAQGLIGAPGVFNSARLYTMIQGGTASGVISAIPAAISTKTSLLLGLWASAGEDIFNNELNALKAAISQYGSSLGPLIAGISVGSEDLYRISPTGILNKENPGVGPDVLAKYIKMVRDVVANTPLANAPIGHVDTWNSWVNGSNKAAIDACDWIGLDTYPYFQDTDDNTIENSKNLFNAAMQATEGAIGGKPVWVTETGFPVSGKNFGKAVPSLENAKTYWQQVGCPMFGKTNVWWYTMQDASPDTPNPSFGLIGNQLTTTPLYDLSCKNVDLSSSTSKSASASATATSSGSGSGSGSGSSQTSQAASSTPNPTEGAGSPGASNAVPSSQLSIESSAPATTLRPIQTGTGSGSGSGSGSSNGTVSTGSPSKPTTAPSSGVAGMQSGSIGAAFAAVMAAILAL